MVLGTTNVCVAIMEAGKPIVIPNLEGKRITPAVVAFLKDGECIVGEQAKGQGILNPQTTIHSTKRFLGFELNEFNSEINQFSYKIAKGIHNLTSVEVNGSSYTPQEISAIMLKKIKKAAEAYLGHEVTEAIITVPALFNDIQRTATKEAGQIAGLNVRRIINEPTAAALAYGMHKKRSNEKIAVFHLGGGSVDISILELQVINGESMFEVTATNGIVNLGGDDFDRVIVDWLAEEFMSKYPEIDLRKDALSLKRLQAAAENAKIELSSTRNTMINLPYIHQNSTGFTDLECTLSRDKFEMLAENLFSKCIECCRQALSLAQLEVEEIHEVILVGGGTRMPKIQELLKAFFKKAPNKSVNPDEAVALGAAIQGGILAQELKDHLLLDVLPLSLGMETQGGRFTMIIPANTTIPTKKTMSFTAILKDQKALELKIYQGERTVARENKCIGQLYIPVLQLSSKSELEIKIVFNVDADGILDVSVLDRMTEYTYSTKISTFTGLSQSYLNQIKSDPKLIQGPSKSFEPEINNSFTDEPTNQQQENNFAEGVELIRTVYDRPLVEFFTNKDTIKIGKGYHLLNNHRSGDFTIKLVKIDDSSLFFGLIIDDKEGTLSTIEGILNESTIKFTKTYHQMQFPVNQKYIVIDEKRFIEYEGNLSQFSDRITGTWHEKKNVVKHQGLTHAIPAQYGTWECEKLSNQIVKTEEERHAFLQMIEDIKSNAIPEKKEETTGNKWTYSEILRLILLIIALLIWFIWSNS